MRVRLQNVTRTPNCAANGMPTVVPGPKKSPSPPAGNSNCFCGLVMATGDGQAANEDAATEQTMVAFAKSLTGLGRTEISVSKFAPGLLRLNRLKNSMN